MVGSDFGIQDLLGMLGGGGEDFLGQLLRSIGLLTEMRGARGKGSARELPGLPMGGQQNVPGGGARQLPGLPGGGGVSTPLQGGATRDAAGNTFDAAGNPLTFAGVTSPVGTMPTDREGLLRALAASTVADQYGNIPGANGSQVSHIPDWTKAALAGNMADPRNWDPTMWVNHPEWHNEDIWRSYQQYQGAYKDRGAYTDPSGGSILPFTKKMYDSGQLAKPSDWGKMPDGSWGYRNPGGTPYAGFGKSPGQFVNDWTRLGFKSHRDWKQAGRPTELRPGELPGMRLPGYSGPAYVNPYESGGS